MPPLSDWTIYLWTAAGILVSLVMPVVRQLAVPPAGGRGFTQFLQSVWPTARPYFFMGVFSALAALVILAGVHVKQLQVDTQWGAFLLGYFCDATVQKLKPRETT